MLEVLTTTDQEVYKRVVNSFGSLIIRNFPVIRKTAKGAWLSVDGGEKLVLNTRKRFAYPTKDEALINFIKRTERHIMLAEGNLERAKEALMKAKARRENI